ncbi:hypothetical protein VMCG_07875 [Cytospora schulzeri]|uniref:Uncharacterized protein n=1 Tax=Cytospora schulzeri TaxID=448051 RepID=A0A423W0E6_9PEZI|nr:hypothetical protein VMCG_07875 [Valsa malicola]
MPSVMMTGGKWKKALLPPLGSRRKQQSSTRCLPASRTVSDIGNTAAKQPINERPSLISGDDDLDDRVISALLGTTVGTGDGDTPSELLSQTCYPQPHRRRDVFERRVEHLWITVPGPEDLVNFPMFTSKVIEAKFTSSHLLGGKGHRIALSPSISPSRATGLRRRNGTFQKGDRAAEKISHSVTSVLAAASDSSGRVSGSLGSTCASKMARFKKNKMFAKFAGALSEHFSAKGSRKDDKSGGTRILPLSDNEASGTSVDCRFSGDDSFGKDKARPDSGRSIPREYLMPVGEVGFHNGQPLDDPFSELSSGHLSTEFDARLKSVQVHGSASQHASTAPVSDPFLTERIMDTSANSILKTPPVGCSTPRTRGRSLILCKSPTKGPQASSNPASEVHMFSPGGPPTSPQKRREVAIICESPTRISTLSDTDPKSNASGDSTRSPSKVRESCDSTRLSSYPPGSTIRHVPRSMGRLTEFSDLSIPTSVRRRSPLVGTKKHPSPSKVQLDLYGELIEKNLALGVFKDPDELAMSFDSPRSTNSPALSPRDKNRLMKGSAASNVDLRKNYKSQGLYPGVSTKSRSRIPQPVKLLPRSRTEMALARDFLPANHSNLTTEDELQWDSSEYKVGRGRGSRCYHCGSMAENGM